jgi:long-chain acyl-CoA synthetase
MKQSLFIEQIMVVGDGRKMPTALIQPNIDYIMQWLSSQNIKVNSLEGACKEKILLETIQKEIENYNQKFGSWEQVKKFELVPEEWSIDAGHLTPTMKLKRKVVKKKYIALIEKMYSS